MGKNGPNTKSHYLSQFYLRGWCDQNSRLWVHHKEGWPPKQTGPGGVGFVRGLYDSSSHPVFSHLDTEADLSTMIENHYAPVWPDIFHRVQDARTKRTLSR